MIRPVRRLGVDRKYWNTSSADACEVVEWQGVGTSGRDLASTGGQWQDLVNTGTSAAGPFGHRDQWQDLVNTGTSGRTLLAKGPVAGPWVYRDSGRTL